MRIGKKGIGMLAVLLICFILKGDILQCQYYTYHFADYTQYTAGYIHNLLGYISIFLVFACGFHEIYDVKRLGLIFLVIQPAKLIMDITDSFIYGRFEVHIFYPLLGWTLLYIIIFFADLLISIISRNKKESTYNLVYKGIIRKNLKYYLKALAISVLGNIAVTVFDLIANVAVANFLISISDYISDTQTFKIVIVYSIFLLILNICLFAAAILFLKGIFSKIYISETHGTKTAEISLTVVTIAMLIGEAVYYLMNYVNPIFYAIDSLKYM